ncbi:protein YhfH [Ornithinibacillus contaminans]|nr:protein YhfH [Ornithinibacillus contaminans]
MITNVLEFFRTLPKKTCQQCGQEINEQSDCYINICEECDHPAR